MTNDSPRGSFWLPVGLAVVAILLRAAKAFDLDWLPNVSPWMALAFAGTALFPRRLSWWLIPGVMLGLDALVQPGVLRAAPGTMLAVYGCLAVAAFFGGRLRRSGVSVLAVLLGTLACSLLFYGVMNTVSWASEPAYARSLAGWWQAQTLGLPGYPPSWTFLRNALLGDAAFAGLLVLARQAEALLRHLPLLQWAPRSAATA
ncbi:MAG: hypothetical protein KDK99_12955 [Verrucomicrobiales bacterium]|nr:hypothetical protein [Verrucomicrobiales bacterium]